MKKRFVWFIGGFTATVLLWLASCAPSATSTTPTMTLPSHSTTHPTLTPTATTSAYSQTPRYGGFVTLVSSLAMTDFDEVYGFFGTAAVHPMRLTNEELWVGDWTLGPAGSNRVDWQSGSDSWDVKIGAVAESWDFSRITDGLMVFKIRKGIHFGLNPNSEASRLVNGRELTADDVAYSLKELASNPRSYIYLNVPGLKAGEIAAPDKWTVTIKIAPETVEESLGRVTDCASIVPPEVVKKYGSMQDWRVSVGSGPFMLTDFVENGSATLARNPNYWGKDPIGPGKGNQIPYVDGVKVLIIPDASTREAALRTGRIDRIGGIDWEAGPTLMKQVPEIKYLQGGRSAAGQTTHFRTDKAPFSDVRVRRALMMAIDWDALNKGLFGGNALMLTWPIGRVPDYIDAYLGLDDPEMPASVKELYNYNSNKSKAMLAEAGYPNGFKTSVICNSNTTVIDYYSVLQNNWAKVGVELTIDPRETAVWNSIMRSRAYEQMQYGSCAPTTSLYRCLNYWGNALTNGSYVDDAKVKEARAQMAKVVIKSQAEANKIHKELMKYVLDQAWAIPYPSPTSYVFWWPWIMNYHGESTLGYFNDNKWAMYVWVDQDLKEKLTGRR
jgi:peptide/nickel transport system substrate-binding protein